MFKLDNVTLQGLCPIYVTVHIKQDSSCPPIKIHKINFIYFSIKTASGNIQNSHFHLNLADFVSKDKSSTVNVLKH